MRLLDAALCGGLLILAAGPARADTEAADRCASTLPPAARALYQTIAPDLKPQASL